MSSTTHPTAKVADGRLILSLPDAETPALWMMDLDEARMAVLRLEHDAKGFFVIKKHGTSAGAKTQTAETVAVYRDRDRGLRALATATKALEKARGTTIGADGRPMVVNAVPRIGKWFVYFVLFWFLLYMLSLDKIALRMILSPFVDFRAVAAQNQAAQQGAAGNMPTTLPGEISPEDMAKLQALMNQTDLSKLPLTSPAGPAGSDSGQPQANPDGTAPVTPGEPAPAGVPMSADDFLSSQPGTLPK
ncbi:MAG: hypothetical protein H6865_04830 [Rhodospirillales bacterium]|nr:hypothetical protein [Alphaproteobacteria bacterium]MCB9986943.1 hypothetical protein [Rhodospirillales bacterium]USO08282.1 MAG: hypothetical protein H6866_03460 [Rhodospirillales bacterium]